MRGVGVTSGKRWGEKYALVQEKQCGLAILVPPTASFARLLPALGAICRCTSRKRGDPDLKTAGNLANVGLHVEEQVRGLPGGPNQCWSRRLVHGPTGIGARWFWDPSARRARLPLTEARAGGRCDTDHLNLSATNDTQITADRAASAQPLYAQFWLNNFHKIVQNRLAFVGEQSVSVGHRRQPLPSQLGEPTHAHLYHQQ
jgi:hypothetical protein